MDKKTIEKAKIDAGLDRVARRLASAAAAYYKENGITYAQAKAKGWGCTGGDGENIEKLIQRKDKMGKTYIIAAKMSGTGTIHDIASDTHDRVIKFAPECQYAVVLAAYFGGKGYTTHKTEQATIAAAKKHLGYSYQIIDAEGNRYAIQPGYYQDSLNRI